MSEDYVIIEDTAIPAIDLSEAIIHYNTFDDISIADDYNAMQIYVVDNSFVVLMYVYQKLYIAPQGESEVMSIVNELAGHLTDDIQTWISGLKAKGYLKNG